MFGCQSGSFTVTVTLALNNAGVGVVEVLNGSNYNKWKDELLYALGFVNLDLALRVDRPAPLTEASTPMEMEYFSKWEHSNYMSLLAMRRSISEHLLSGLPETTTARELLTALGERYLVLDMAESSVLLKKLTSMYYDNVGGVRDYILKMISLQSKLKSLEIPLPDKFIILHALNSLPPNFSQIKTAFISQNESWTVNDLISKCVVEEEKLKREKTESAFLVSSSRPSFVKGKKHSKRFHPSASKNKGFKRHGHDQNEGS
ncbi:hypothetical protein MLD38_028664 [Melastoma candidum]|uniref:Uncharacterized protein n=1 Tax=Melastoma candidum TaxID=119954 RepID=A0ACB9N1F7_9MYRT|nr:hypothetical protein MLD38_028664 [Melastoma candidum]